jgi:hypothetical protein
MIDRVRKAMGVPQNLGWLDRVIRVVVGFLLLGVPAVMLSVQTSMATWHNYVMIVSVYPFLTAILGWDPLYYIFGAKTCGTSERNPCGTFPYEVDAALGRHPIPDSDIEHSLSISHHKKSSSR